MLSVQEGRAGGGEGGCAHQLALVHAQRLCPLPQHAQLATLHLTTQPRHRLLLLLHLRHHRCAVPSRFAGRFGGGFGGLS